MRRYPHPPNRRPRGRWSCPCPPRGRWGRGGGGGGGGRRLRLRWGRRPDRIRPDHVVPGGNHRRIESLGNGVAVGDVPLETVRLELLAAEAARLLAFGCLDDEDGVSGERRRRARGARIRGGLIIRGGLGRELGRGSRGGGRRGRGFGGCRGGRVRGGRIRGSRVRGDPRGEKGRRFGSPTAAPPSTPTPTAAPPAAAAAAVLREAGRRGLVERAEDGQPDAAPVGGFCRGGFGRLSRDRGRFGRQLRNLLLGGILR